MLEPHHQIIDRGVVWGTEPDLELLLDRWYEDAGAPPGAGDIHVLRPRARSAAVR